MSIHPELLKKLRHYQPTLWLNSGKKNTSEATAQLPLSYNDIVDASDRLQRFAPYIEKVYPQTTKRHGLIESELLPIPHFGETLAATYHIDLSPQQLWLKQDSHLPISGSIKARGGIYEVLKTAETIACRETEFTQDSDYAELASDRYRELFSHYQIAVGSTGNLGLSIGIMAAQLGFQTTVHMSADARQWKKQKLRDCGVTVQEYSADYAVAVANGREQAAADDHCHFVDDEHSSDLFLGYSVAALRLKQQLNDANILIGSEHPLIAYLPCGVGGAPGGIAFGLKLIFGDSVHCFFAEPTHAPCMLAGLASGEHANMSVYALGLDGHTAADGLAVARPSALVCEMMQSLLSGCYTVTDDTLYQLLAMMHHQQQIDLEPSALAGAWGPVALALQQSKLQQQLQLSEQHYRQATHLVWATGGNMVPKDEMLKYLYQGEQLLTP